MDFLLLMCKCYMFIAWIIQNPETQLNLDQICVVPLKHKWT